MKLLVLIILLTTNLAFALEGSVSTTEKIGIKKVKLTLKYDNQELSILSGERGDFKFRNIPENKSFELIASKNNYGTISVFGNTSQSEKVSFELNPEIFELTGRVVTPSGEGVSSFLINGTQFTDENGYFKLNIPYESKYNVIATKSDYITFNKIEGIMLGNIERVIVADFD